MFYQLYLKVGHTVIYLTCMILYVQTSTNPVYHFLSLLIIFHFHRLSHPRTFKEEKNVVCRVIQQSDTVQRLCRQNLNHIFLQEYRYDITLIIRDSLETRTQDIHSHKKKIKRCWHIMQECAISVNFQKWFGKPGAYSIPNTVEQ